MFQQIKGGVWLPPLTRKELLSFQYKAGRLAFGRKRFRVTLPFKKSPTRCNASRFVNEGSNNACVFVSCRDMVRILYTCVENMHLVAALVNVLYCASESISSLDIPHRYPCRRK